MEVHTAGERILLGKLERPFVQRLLTSAMGTALFVLDPASCLVSGGSAWSPRDVSRSSR